jgi:hypothetical protein
LIFLLFIIRYKNIFEKNNLNFNSSIIFCLSLIFSTISWNHHYIIMIFPLAFLFNEIISRRKYTYMIPYLIIGSQIIYPPKTGGFPFNQILLFSTILFLFLLIYYQIKNRKKDNFFKN